MQYFSVDLCTKLQEKGLVSESGHWYLRTTKKNEYVIGGLPFTRANPVTAFIFQDILTKDNAMKLWGENPDCKVCEGSGVVANPQWLEFNKKYTNEQFRLMTNEEYDKALADHFGISVAVYQFGTKEFYKMLPLEEEPCGECEGTGEGVGYKGESKYLLDLYQQSGLEAVENYLKENL